MNKTREKYKIMVIDDDKLFLEELRQMLTGCDYEVTAINNSEFALFVANETRPDCILLDLSMPEKNGFQVALEIKSRAKLKGVPIIAMTGRFIEGCAFPMESCGISGYLKKPFNELDVINRIESAIAEMSV